MVTKIHKQNHENVVVGVLVIVATVFAMSFADAVIKYVSSSLPLWQIYVVRSLIAIAIIATIFFANPKYVIHPVSMKWTLIRSLMLTLMYVAIYAAAPVLSLAVIAATLYTGPLFITLFSALLLNERVEAAKIVAIVGGFIGVIAIVKPASSDFNSAALIPVVAAILYALAAILTRSKCANERPLVLALSLNFTLLVVGSIVSLLIALWQPGQDSLKTSYPFLFGDWISMGNKEWGVLVFLAVLIVLIGIGLAKAYQSASPTIIATFDYSYLIFAVIWGYLFFSDIPDAGTVLGILLIFLSGIIVIFPKRILSKKSMQPNN